MTEGGTIKRTVRKVAVGAAGVTAIAVGVALIPLPDPGSLVILGGLTVPCSEFPAPRRLSDSCKQRIGDLLKRAGSR